MNSSPIPFPLRGGALLFLSGACSLVYQSVWLREFRLMLGASTLSNAAVLAVFMGGLGVGGFVFGRRVERHERPLALYGSLELAISLAAAVSPFVLDALRAVYLAGGGEASLGFLATPLRLAITAAAIGLPVVCMGGTLPAAARALTRADDENRTATAWLYAINTTGAVVGALASTFFLLEVFGSRTTLWLAALVNTVVGLTARALARSAARLSTTPPPSASFPVPTTTTASPSRLRGAAFASGLVFLLAELVWYRMSAPLLGGSTYSFGLVLAMALAGIGIGGFVYALVAPRIPATHHLGTSFVVAGLLLALPLCIGDELALLAYHLREWGQTSFPRLVGSWALVTAFLVLPFAILSGYQFPMMIALRGHAAEHVGRDAGEIYAANTFGSILGSLLGGFVVVPALGAVVTWRAAAVLMLLVGAALAPRAGRFMAAALFAVVVVTVPGPGPLWRHQPIGAGRAELSAVTANEHHAVVAEAGRVLWEREGRESILGVTNAMGYSPLVNGKSDGNSVLDAGTAIGSALVPALVHGNVKRGFVIGLGTGQTAGWLGVLPAVERVDVVEIEPAFREFAELCKDTNADVLRNPQVNLIVGDGREVLLTSKDTYDLILSEPSNPYRSGLASFYSTDFYAGVKKHLNADGMFGQWMQGYEVGADAVATVAATLRSQFAEVSLWQLAPGDLLFLASDRHQVVDVPALERSLSDPRIARVFERFFSVTKPTEFLGLLVAAPRLVDRIASGAVDVNTDDNNVLEYMFARSVGRTGTPVRNLLLGVAESLGEARLPTTVPVDDVEIRRARYHAAALEGALPSSAAAVVGAALASWSVGDVAGSWAFFQTTPPRNALERLAAAEARAHAGPPGPDLDAMLQAVVDDGRVAEARVLAAQAALTSGDGASIDTAVAAAADALRREPFPIVGVCSRFFERLLSAPPRASFLAAFREPFVGASFERARVNIVLRAASSVPVDAACGSVLAALPGGVPWTREGLQFRAACLRLLGDARTDQADDDVRTFADGEQAQLILGPPSQP